MPAGTASTNAKSAGIERKLLGSFIKCFQSHFNVMVKRIRVSSLAYPAAF